MAESNVIAQPQLSIAGKDYRVTAYRLAERISTVPELECELFTTDGPLPKLDAILDKRAIFTLERSDGSGTRTFTGMVVRASNEIDADDQAAIRVLVTPLLWNLGERADCRIFQDKSAVDIVKDVLERAGVAAAQQDWRVTEAHPSRVYTVQYRETDLDFVGRLLFEEGISFSVIAKDGKDVVVFGDARSGLGKIEGTTSLPWVEEFGAQSSLDKIFALSHAVRVRSDKVFARDYNYDKPKLKVEGSAEGTDPGGHELEIYDYPAGAEDPSTAERIAKVLLEAVQAERDVVEGEAGSLTLVPGFTFSVEDHPYDSLNQEYLVTASTITGTNPRHMANASAGAREASMKIAFEGVPTKATHFRPPRRHRDRIVVGTQTATTTGSPGEEIHTDAGGHVKVLFHWDRLGKKDDTSSRWIRTSQLPTGGSMLLPRVGWEVTVRHLDGDVDRPLVMSRMYNAVQKPPYALPQHAARTALGTHTTPGGGSLNELRMTDTKGSEEVSFNASKDMTTKVKNDATESIKNDHKKKVGGDQTKNVTNSVTVNIGADHTTTVGGKQNIKAETFLVHQVTGDHSLTITGKRDLKVGGDHKREVTANSKLKVGSKQVDLVVGSVTEQTLSSFKHDVGAALIELAVANRTVTVGTDRKETAGAAKIILVKGGRGVSVTGSMNVKVAGAIVNIAKGDRTDAANGSLTELAAGAQIIKANNVMFQADAALTLVMGASILSLTPASVAVLGLSAKLDGDVADTAALVVDN